MMEGRKEGNEERRKEMREGRKEMREGRKEMRKEGSGRISIASLWMVS